MKRKILSLILCFMILPLTVLLSACGKAKPKSMAIFAQTTYEYGDDFSLGENAYILMKMSKGDDKKIEIKPAEYDNDSKKAVFDDYEIDYSSFNSYILGEYEIKVKYTKDEKISTSYKVRVVAKRFADDDVTISAEFAEYDGAGHSLDVSCSIVDSVVSYSTDGRNYSTTKPTFVNAGSYDVYFKVEKFGYQPPVSGVRTFVINPKEVSVSWTNLEFTYDGNAHIPECSVSSGLVGQDECEVILQGEKTNAGTYSATIKNLTNKNYTVSSADSTKQFAIKQKSVTIPTVEGTFTYTSATQRPYIAEDDENKNYYTRTGVSYAINAGTYNIEFDLKDKDNFVWSDNSVEKKTCSWSIAKADYNDLVWNVDNNYSVTYDGNEKVVEIQNLPESVVATYTNNKKTDAGTWTASATLEYDDVNFNEPTIENLTWTIKKAKIKETDLTLPIIVTDRAFIENSSLLYDLVIPDSHFSWQNPLCSLKDVVEEEDIISGTPITSLILPAIYSHDDDNYESLVVYLEIVIKDNAKDTFSVYNLNGLADNTNDIAYTSPTIVYDGNEHTIDVFVSGENVSGNASQAEITYFYADKDNYSEDSDSGFMIPTYSENKPKFSEAGEYVIYFKVAQTGYNTYYGTSKLTISPKQIVLSSAVAIDEFEHNLTTDKKLKDINAHADIENNISVTYSWKEPETYLKLGKNEYTLIISSTNANYEKIEVNVEIDAVQGVIVKNYKLNEKQFSCLTYNEQKYLQMEIGEISVVDFGVIPDEYIVCLVKNGNLSSLENNKYTIYCNDEFYINNYEFVIVPKGNAVYAEAVQRFVFIPEAPSYLVKLEMVTLKNNTYKTTEIDLTQSVISVQGELVEFRLFVVQGKTGAIYINNQLYNGEDFEGFVFDADYNNLVIAVSDKNGEIVKYNNFVLKFPASGRTNHEKYVKVTDKDGETEKYEFAFDEKAIISQNLAGTELYVYDSDNDIWVKIGFGDIYISKELVIFKSVYREGDYSVEQIISIFGLSQTQKSYKTEYEKKNIYGYSLVSGDLKSDFDNDDCIRVLKTLNVASLKVYDNENNIVELAEFIRIDNHLLVKIPVGAYVYMIALKIVNVAILDSNTDCNIAIVSKNRDEYAFESVNSNTISLDENSLLAFKLLNPVADVSCNDNNISKTCVNGVFIFSIQEEFNATEAVFTITAGDGTKKLVTLYISK